MARNPDGRPENEAPEEDDVDEEIEESFPASDPPSHWSGSVKDNDAG